MYLFVMEKSMWTPGLSTDYMVVAASDDKEKLEEYRLDYMKSEYGAWLDDVSYDEGRDVYWFDFELGITIGLIIIEVPVI